MQANAVVNEADNAGAAAKSTARSTQVDDLPSLAEIRGGGGNFDKARRLDDKSLGEAMKGAKDFNMEDGDLKALLKQFKKRITPEEQIEADRRLDEIRRSFPAFGGDQKYGK